MKFRNRLLVLSSVLLLSLSAKAQDREIGLSLGTTFYQGDLSQNAITLNETKPALGLLLRYYFAPRIDVKGFFNFGMISADDQNYSDDPQRHLRNLSFKSNIMELGGQAEFNILPYISNSKRYRIAPYVFVGVAVYHFNPKTKDSTGNWVALQPLGTEGQTLPGGKKYSLYQLAIPFGIGVKYSLGHFWNLGFEIGQRKLFTDYLDDVSGNYPDLNLLKAQDPEAAALSFRGGEVDPKYLVKYPQPGSKWHRGNNNNLDMYVFAGFTLTKTIRRFSCTGF